MEAAMTTSSTLPRITARIKPDTQALLTRAAALSGVSSINAFVLNAAIEKAKQLVEREQILELSQRDAQTLAKALDAPAQVHTRLHEAGERYRNYVQP
jgi:uncharacterized protein (DUF1778 family)